MGEDREEGALAYWFKSQLTCLSRWMPPITLISLSVERWTLNVERFPRTFNPTFNGLVRIRRRCFPTRAEVEEHPAADQHAENY